MIGEAELKAGLKSSGRGEASNGFEGQGVEGEPDGTGVIYLIFSTVNKVIKERGA